MKKQLNILIDTITTSFNVLKSNILTLLITILIALGVSELFFSVLLSKIYSLIDSSLFDGGILIYFLIFLIVFPIAIIFFSILLPYYFIPISIITKETINKKILNVQDVLKLQDVFNIFSSKLKKVIITNFRVFMHSIPWMLLFGIGVIIPLYKYQFAPYITTIQETKDKEDPLKKSAYLVRNESCSIFWFEFVIVSMINIIDHFINLFTYSLISEESLTNNYLASFALDIPSNLIWTLLPISQVIILLRLLKTLESKHSVDSNEGWEDWEFKKAEDWE